jgi:hypothetical protein
LPLYFGAPLTNAGGTVSLLTGLTPSFETTCLNATCSGPSATFRLFTSGSVTTINSIGAPALSPAGLGVLALLLLGFSALFLRKRGVSAAQ